MKTLIYPLLMVFWLPVFSQSSNHVSIETAQQELHDYRIESIRSDTTAFDRLEQKFDDLSTFFKTHNDYTSYATCLYEKSTIQINKGESQQIIELAEAQINDWQAKGFKKKEPKALAVLYNILGFAREREGLYGSALDAFNESLKILGNLENANIERADALYGKSSILLETWDTREAMINMEKATGILEKKSDILSQYLLAKTLTLLGDAYTYENINLKSLQEGLMYHHKALSICNKIFPKKKSALTGLINNNIGLIYWYMHIKSYQPNLNINYNSLDSSLHYYAKGLTQLEEFGGNQNFFLGRSENNLGMAFLSNWWKSMSKYLKEFDKQMYVDFSNSDYAALHQNPKWKEALEEVKEGYDLTLKQYHKSLRTKQNALSEKHPYIIRNYNNLGSCYLAGGFYEKSLSCLDSAFITNQLSEISNRTDLYNLSNYDFDSFVVPIQLLSTLKWKSRVLSHKKTMEKGTEQYYNTSIELLQTYELIVRLIEDLVTSYNEKESQVIQLGKYNNMYESGIAIAYDLFEQTKDKKFLKEVFWFSEKSKANLSRLLIRENNALKYIEDKAVFREDSLFRVQISDAQTKLLQQKRISLTDSKTLELEDSLDAARASYKLFKNDMEKEYPIFRDKKYDSENLDIDVIRTGILSQKKSTAIVDFLLGTEHLTTTLITQDTIIVNRLNDVQHIDSLLGNMIVLLSKKDAFINDKRKNVKDFGNVANQLYKILLKDVLESKELEDIQNLIIIPSLTLGYLPFETLVTKEVNDEKDFEDLEYLIKKYAIGYGYSSALLKNALEHSEKQQKKQSYIGFACSNLGSKQIALNRGEFGELKGVTDEVISGKNIFDGQVFLDEKGSENVFDNLTESPSILHLAMHTQLNMKKPMESKFLFCESEDAANDGEDGDVYAYELYNKNKLLNGLDLAVLTACETGYGPEIKGEGVVSLSRTFLQNNCKSTLMSLWLVNDISTPKLIEPFFQNLKNGLSKSEALRRAKLNYINTETLNHPYYWASCILSGNDEELMFESNSSYSRNMLILFIGGICSVLMLFLIGKRMSKT